MSAPEQNSPLAPVSTTTRSSWLSASLSNSSWSSLHITSSMAFFRCGRFMVIVTTRFSLRSTVIVSSSRVSMVIAATILIAVGFNPYRKFRASPADYVLVLSATVIVLALLFWAVLG